MTDGISSTTTRLKLGMAWQSYFLLSYLVLMLVLQPLEAQPSAQKTQTVKTNTPIAAATNTSAHATKDTSEHADSSTIRETWLFYLNSLALTIVAGAALLVALAILKMQSFTISLTTIERLIAEAFHKRDKLDDYLKNTGDLFLNERWRAYFNAVDTLAHETPFPRQGRYNETKAFVNCMTAQGRVIEDRYRHLHTSMKPIFIATASVAGPAILALPAARWISPQTLIVVWAISGVFSIILLAYFLYIICTAFQSK